MSTVGVGLGFFTPAHPSQGYCNPGLLVLEYKFVCLPLDLSVFEAASFV